MYKGDQISFVSERPTVNQDYYQGNGEWDLVNTTVDDSTMSVEVAGMEMVLPMITFTVYMSRMPKYFENTVIIPCIILTLMTGMVFLLPSESGEKVSLGTTLLLSYTVLILMVSDVTPRSAEHTPVLSKPNTVNVIGSNTFQYCIKFL